MLTALSTARIPYHTSYTLSIDHHSRAALDNGKWGGGIMPITRLQQLSPLYIYDVVAIVFIISVDLLSLLLLLISSLLSFLFSLTTPMSALCSPLLSPIISGAFVLLFSLLNWAKVPERPPPSEYN